MMIVAGALLIAAGFYWAGRASVIDEFALLDMFEQRERDDDGYNFISPLLECEAPQHLQFKSVRNTEEAVEKIVQAEHGRGNVTDLSVYFRDLNNGPRFTINEGTKFVPASLLKVPIAMAFLMAAEQDHSLAQRSVSYDGEHLDVTPTFVDFPALEAGKTYTTVELLNRMLVYSDNDAMRLLFEMMPKKVLSEVYGDLSIKEHDDPQDEITVVEYASFFRMLYNATYLSKPLSEYLLGILARTEFKDGLRAGIPNSVVISHKFGEREDKERKVNQLHDCGIVYAPGKPYLICVMTRGKDFNKLAPVITRVSEAVYKNFVIEGK